MNKIIDNKLQSNDKLVAELTQQLDKIRHEKEKDNKDNIVVNNNRNTLSKLTIKQDTNKPHAIHFNSINNKHIKNKQINNLLKNNFKKKKNNYSNFHILKGLYISENKKKPNNINNNNTNHQMLSNNSNGSNKKKTINTNTIDSIIFFTTYNKINNINSNRNKSNNKKKSSNIALYRKRYKSNPSVSMKIDDDKTDYFFRCLNNCGIKYNTGVKNSRFLKIMNMIPNSKFPLTTKQMYAKHNSNLSLAKKSCHNNNSNDLMKNINNHSSLNLRSGIKD